MIDLADLEGDAAWLLRGFGSDRVPGARALVEAHLGPRAIMFVQLRGGGDAQLATVGGRKVICVRPRLPAERMRWALLHELAEWHLEGRVDADIEQASEQLTACIAVPRQAFHRELRTAGRAWPGLAKAFGVTETCVALRYGEACDVPIAVAAPTHARARGPEREWQDEHTIRRLARAKTLPLGLHRERLADDARRIVLAEEPT